MAIGLYYTMEFTNVEEVFVKVLIGDITVQTEGTPEIIQLDPAGDPLKISTIDEGENKFTPIKAQQATITFHSNGDTSLLTFSEGADDRFPVTILYGTTIIFYGFLSLADNEEPFLPPKNEVVLTANDKLGALKDIPLTDFDGENPNGKYTIAQLIAMCLQKTGLSLELRVINNLRHGTGSKTFQATFGSPSAPFILMDNANTQFFYVGQRVEVTGTASNNVEFTVVSVNTGFVGVIGADVDFTLEADIVTTFTDVTTADHFYKGTYLDAKTFEEAIGVSENCYDVLKKILGFDCFITQYKERWWICRIDEYDNNPFYVARFDENGEFIDSYIDANLLKSIGKDEIHWFEGEATNVLPMRPIGFDKLIYNFVYPIELVCNQDFSRGTGDDVQDANPNQTIELVPECWEFFRNFFDGSTWVDGTPQTDAHGELVKRYEYGYEKERYLRVEHEDVSGADDVHYFKSQPIDLRQGDKINISVDFKLDADYGLTSLNPVQITLVPYDGSAPWFWEMDALSNINQWVQRATVTTNPFSTTFRWQGTANDEWENVGGESLPLPASGQLFIKLAANFNIFVPFLFSNLQISYTPFINGSYRAYNGRYEKVTRTETGYLSKIEEEVFISDAEGKLFKGAMFFLANSIYQLTVKWYNASHYALGSPTDLTMVKPFGNHQAYAVWNQYRLANRVFQLQKQGFGEDIPSLVHKYSITDNSPHSQNRYFLMLTCDKDLFLCNIKGTIEQVYHTVEGKSYDDPHEFKYIS